MTKKIQRWSTEEKELLKSIYNDDKKHIMESFPTRSWKSVKHMIDRMGLPRDKKWVKFTEEEDEILKDNYMKTKEELVSLLPNRKWDSIIQRCTKLGLDRPKAWNMWTKEEEDILKSCFSYEDADIKLPNRSRSMIINKAVKMGLTPQLTSHWQKWEDDYIIDNYGDIEDVEDMLKILKGRSVQAIYDRANKLGVSRGNDNKSILDSDIISLYEEGMYMSQISRELNITPHTVKHRLIRNGITPEVKILYGEEAPSWKGGVSSENTILRGRSEYREWRNGVYERDNYTCQRCGDDRGGNLHAHHIRNFSEYNEGRFDIDNGITLCDTCHNVGPNSFHMKYGTRNNNMEQLIEHIKSYDPDEIKTYDEM